MHGLITLIHKIKTNKDDYSFNFLEAGIYLILLPTQPQRVLKLITCKIADNVTIHVHDVKLIIIMMSPCIIYPPSIIITIY